MNCSSASMSTTWDVWLWLVQLVRKLIIVIIAYGENIVNNLAVVCA